MTIETLGIDIAKNVFQLHGVNRAGRLVLTRRVKRHQLLPVIARTEPCTIAIEACTGAFYWQRRFEEFGHQVKIVSPQYVKPFVRRQKIDSNDAEAICTAARQAHMRFVPNPRTGARPGITFPKSITRARRLIPGILEDAGNELTDLAREAIAELHDLFRDLDRRIASFDKKIDRVFRSSEACQRIARIKGVGPMTATAIVAAIGDGAEFKNGRHLAAWVGLVHPPTLERPAYRFDGHLQAR